MPRQNNRRACFYLEVSSIVYYKNKISSGFFGDFSKMRPCLKRLLVMAALSTVASGSSAQWLKEEKAESLEEALLKGKAHFDFRLRYEDAEQGSQGAQALTLRSRVAYQTLPYEFFTAFIELDDVRAIPDDQNYNSGSNAQFDDLLVEDPEGAEINQAWLAYDVANTLFKYGRQTISLNNERFLGGDAWRQNEQSFTGLSIHNESLNYLRFEFAQLNHVLTNADKTLDTSQQDLNAKLFNINYRGFWLNDLSLYALWISDHPDQHQWESSTYGIRYAGDFGGNAFHDFALAFELEYARQEDAGANPLNYQLAYQLIDLSLSYQDISATLGYERLGADDNAYFVTPLGSLHSFQGVSGIFENNGLGNIPGGIQDRYLGLTYRTELACATKPFAFSISAHYHDYQADKVRSGVKSYGEEWILKSTLEMASYDLFVQYADYQADQFSQDKQSVWLGLGIQF